VLRWFYVAMHVLAEAGAARRDVRIRFRKARVKVLGRKLGSNRVIPSPDDRARLPMIGIVTRQTCCRFRNYRSTTAG
jgi:hypothetical protein